MSRRRVVVTGLGCVSPVGNTVADSWANVLAGKSGIDLITKFDTSNFSCRIAGEVKGFDLESYISAKDARAMDAFIHFGIAAAAQAVQDAGLPTGEALHDELATRIACVIGSGIGGLPLIENTHAELTARGPRRITPFFVPASIINMVAGHVSMRFGFKGPNLSVVTACTTGLHCIGQAGRMIEYGDADVAVALNGEMSPSRRGELSAKLSGVLGCEVDVADLRMAQGEFLAQIVLGGEVAVKRDASFLAELAIRALAYKEDMRPMVLRALKDKVRRTLDG